MMLLSEDQLKNLTKEALVIIVSSLQDQLNVYQYLELLLTEIPKQMEDNNIRFIDDLLPWSPSIQEKCPSKYKKS